ncbi:MAG: hypothetical protein GY696_09880 [Gammaproteobacteria bacterium]|nr:hypothetical protein [Gammaproteobacteria bacterium]
MTKSPRISGARLQFSKPVSSFTVEDRRGENPSRSSSALFMSWAEDCQFGAIIRGNANTAFFIHQGILTAPRRVTLGLVALAYGIHAWILLPSEIAEHDASQIARFKREIQDCVLFTTLEIRAE